MFVETRTLLLLWPEIVLVLAATAIFVGGAFQRSRTAWSIIALASYAAAAALLWLTSSTDAVQSVASGPITIDALSISLRWTALIAGFVLTLAVSSLAQRDTATEYLGSLMLAVAGAMIASVANELVLLFVGLELISVPTYVLLFLGGRDRASNEATMKYFFLSIFSSALLLYGFSFLYGMSGTTLIAGNASQTGIREQLTVAINAARREQPLVAAANAEIEAERVADAAAGDDAEEKLGIGSPAVTLSRPASLGLLAPLALVLIVAGFGFKLAAAPFQFYAPDVYQGTSNVNAGILAVLPKIAGVAGFIRLLVLAMPAAADFAWQLALVLAVLTMTIGNVCALWQRNLRRLMAYSSIAHSGYILIGLAVATGISSAQSQQIAGGVSAMIFYLFVYALASLGVFAALAYLGSERREVSSVDELAGLSRTNPVMACVLAVFMFSLAGIPPLAGFWGKFAIFGSAIEMATSTAPTSMTNWFAMLAVVGVLNAAIAAAYYLRIIAAMYFQPAAAAPAAAGGQGAWSAAVLCAVLVIVAGLFPGRSLGVAGRADRQIRAAQPVAQRLEATPPSIAAASRMAP